MTTSKMRPEDVKSLRDLALYVAEHADDIFVVGERSGKTKALSDLPTRQALRVAANIVSSGKVPLIERVA